MPNFTFFQDQHYTRKQIMANIGAPDAKGGAWFTGVVSFEGAHFIFSNIGTAGRTGHNYGNYFIGDDLDWSGATRSNRRNAQVQAITAPGAEVHLFYRRDSSAPFTYAGLANALTVSDTSPVRILWSFLPSAKSDIQAASSVNMTEGAVKTVYVKTYERSPHARLACIEHHGAECKVCQEDMGSKYGNIGLGYIHVHHLKPISSTDGIHEIDPVLDLVPVCPNCHAMLHRVKPPLEISELQDLIRQAQLPIQKVDQNV